MPVKATASPTLGPVSPAHPAQPTPYPGPGPLGSTDLRRWRLDSSDHGRHCWRYLSLDEDALDRARPGGGQNDETLHALGLRLDKRVVPCARDSSPGESARNAFEFYKRLQAGDGHWSGEYGGPHFIQPGLIISMYLTETPIPEEWKVECSRYLANMQRRGGKGDEGWGLHVEGTSTVFGTVLNYVVLRICGVPPDHPMMVKARNTIHHHGGATGIPSWGKAWLALLGCYDWEGLNPVPPELWLLPEWLPIHPWRWWPHTRVVYLPMGYLWGRRWVGKFTPLIASLREELYTEPYETIHWPSCRNKIAPVDLYVPHPLVLDVMFSLLSTYETYLRPYLGLSFIRRAGLKRCLDLMRMEDENTSYQCIAPVSGALHLVCTYASEGASSPVLERRRRNLKDYFWLGREGMMSTGTNGSQCWDAAFIGQAVVKSGLAEREENRESVGRLLEWLDECQMRENPKWWREAYRQGTKGAWPFSTREQGYTVSDCTGEALKAVMGLQELSFTPKLVSMERMQDAVDVMLSMQNRNGGWATYEEIRAPHWIELLNPAEVFGLIMTEYSYVECTTTVLTALSLFRRRNPTYRSSDISAATAKAIKFIHDVQRPDGSWYGSWAICFTYAAMFALESLALVGETYETSESVRRACEFLVKRQMEDGGWGESFKSCETGQYCHHVKSQVVQTSWVILALLYAKCPEPEVIRKAVRLIMSRQLEDGSFEQEAIEGIFNKTCAISYPNYKFSWTIWALGLASKTYPDMKW